MTIHRAAIIGLGSIGLRMLEGFAAHPSFAPVLAWDPSGAARERAGTRYPHLTLASECAPLFDRSAVDVIYLACPPITHREHALRALRAGIPVLCEKPLGVDLAESESLAAAFGAHDAPNAVNLVFASGAAATALADTIRSGSAGRIQWVDIHLHLPSWAARRYAEAPWLARREQGGFIREVTTHFVFLCQRLLGELTLESSFIRWPLEADTAETFADVRLAAGSVPVTLQGTTLGAPPEVNHFTVFGERKTLRISNLHQLEVFAGEHWTPAFAHGPRPELDTYLRQLDSLSAMLQGREHSLPDFEEALGVQRIIEDILSRSPPPRHE